MRFHFIDYVFDSAKFELRHAGEVVDATPQVLSMLQFLLINRHRLVSKDELVDEIWGGRAISDTAIAVRMRALREAIGDTGAKQGLIKTIRGQGFRFVGEVSVEQQPPQADALPASVPPAHALSTGQPKEATPNPQERAPSIAVLPLKCLGEPRAEGFLAQALPDEILTSLSKLRSLIVISRGSSFRHPSFASTPSEVGQDLGADYVLAGQIELGPDRLVLALELADTRTEKVLSRDNHQISLGEVHEVREEIVAQIANQIEGQISRNELMRARMAVPTKISAWQWLHRGLDAVFYVAQHDVPLAIKAFDTATAIDPTFARAHAGRALAELSKIQMAGPSATADDLNFAERTARHALALDPFDPLCNVAVARTAFMLGEEAAARSAFLQAIKNAPSNLMAHLALARLEAYAGQHAAAFQLLDRASILGPIESTTPFSLGTVTLTELAAQANDQAAQTARKLELHPSPDPFTLSIMLTAYLQAGDNDEAARIAARLKSGHPSFSSSSLDVAWPTLARDLRELFRASLGQYGIG